MATGDRALHCDPPPLIQHQLALDEDLASIQRQLTSISISNDQHVISYSPHGTSSSVRYNLDILRLIFNATFPSPDLLDTSPSTVTPCSWVEVMSSKLSLALVCKAWHHVVIPFVYEDVVFHRLRQIAAFARTLKSDTALGGLVRRLKIDCSVPLQYQQAVEECLSSIYGACTDLRRLSYTLNYFRWRWYRQQGVAVTPLQIPTAIANRVVEWECGTGTAGDYDPEGRWVNTIGGLIPFSAFPNLVSLTLHCLIPPECLPIDIELLCLRDLRLSRFRPVRVAAYIQPLVSWHIPQLQRLAIIPYTTELLFTTGVSHAIPSIDEWLPFLMLHGQTLRSLDLGQFTSHYSLLTVIKTRTSLKHIVLGNSLIPKNLTEFLDSLGDAQDIHIDIWAPRAAFYRNNSPIDESPQLFWDAVAGRKNVRLLDTGLTCVPNLPWSLPPRRQSPQAMERDGYKTIFHWIGRLCIVETVWCLMREEADWDTWFDTRPVIAESLAAVERENPHSDDWEVENSRQAEEVDTDLDMDEDDSSVSSDSWASTTSGSDQEMDASELEELGNEEASVSLVEHASIEELLSIHQISYEP
ncbi:hypothetical protein K474DRAFT_1662631 [Panus rudis PR-1116 ss-1]|nr:hypothetical protein K474DRAFT_1662631 [Panus rudis PR-1116 ss-1]